MNFLKSIFKKKNTDTDIEVLQKGVTSASLDEAYKKYYPEIESLRLYDKGEKTINAPDLQTVVRNLQ